MTLSAEDSAALSELEKQRESTSQSTTKFVDNTMQIVQSYQEDLDTVLEHTETHKEGHLVPIVANERPIILSERIASKGLSVQSSISLDGTSCAEADVRTTTPLPGWSPDALNFQSSNCANVNGIPSLATISYSVHLTSPSSTFVAPVYFDVDLPVQKREQIQLIRAYLQETGIWCEATDTARHFTVCYIHSLMNNKPFVAAAMALASRQRDAVQKITNNATLNLYRHALQSLIHYEPSQCGQATLVCCILLSVYEMMTSDASEWRRHLKVSQIARAFTFTMLMIIGLCF